MNFRKNLISIFLLFLCFPALGQNQIWATDFNQSIVKYVNHGAETILVNKIQSRTVIHEKIGRNGLPSNSKTYIHYIYNKRGQILREDSYYGSKKMQRSTSYIYNEKNQVVRKVITPGKRKSPEYIIDLTYFNDTLISGIQFNRKGKNTYAFRYFYTPDGKITEQRGYSKGELESRIEYDYYEDGSKKEVRYYEDSLKLERTFRYDCGITNSLLNEKQKDTTTRCSKKEDLGDGTLRTIDETRDEKGRIRRVVTDWNKDKKWYEYRSYDSKNRLVYSYRSETLADGKIKTVYILYKKGKEKRQVHSLQWRDSFGNYTFQNLEKDLPEDIHYSTYTFFSSIN